MQKNIYIVNIQLLIDVPTDVTDGEAYVQDALMEMLSSNLQRSGALLDWRYQPDADGNYPEPKFVANIETSEYVENSIFNLVD